MVDQSVRKEFAKSTFQFHMVRNVHWTKKFLQVYTWTHVPMHSLKGLRFRNNIIDTLLIIPVWSGEDQDIAKNWKILLDNEELYWDQPHCLKGACVSDTILKRIK